MNNKQNRTRCRARTKAGKPCGAAPTESGFCVLHGNPNKASEWGRIGGRSKGRASAETADPLPTLDNAMAVRETVARLIADVFSGKLHPRIAAGLSPLLSLQLRAIETTDHERRLAQLEKHRAEAPSEAAAAAGPGGAGTATPHSPKPEKGGMSFSDAARPASH
jgi:hypothetical protein